MGRESVLLDIFLLIDSARKQSSIDNQHVAGDKTRCVGGKKDGCASELI